MEPLFPSGELMVSERRGFPRFYDLRGRVLPAEVELTEPAPDQVARFTIRRALGGLGIAADGDVHWGRQRVREDVLQELVDAGEVGVGEDGGSVAVAVSGGVVGVAVGTAGPGVGERVGTVWR